MDKIRFLVMAVLLGNGLTACQQLKTPASLPNLSAEKIAELKSAAPPNLVSLHCTGSIACEFAKLNTIVVIDENTRQPNDAAIQASIVRFEEAALSKPLASKYFVTMQPGSNEVKLRFYPVTHERAENFSLIHDFKAGRNYSINMFRQRTNNGSSSLLSMAAPEPLCIQLLQDEQVIRRFCRPFDPATGLGEFIEQPIRN